MPAAALVAHRLGCSETSLRALQGDLRGCQAEQRRWQTAVFMDAPAGLTDLGRA